MIREACPYTGLNRRLERSCTDESPCTNCMMDEDVRDNRALYDAMAD